MPRGVYDRSKMKRSNDNTERFTLTDDAKRFTLTIEGDTAQRWAKVERKLNEQYPFKITRMQILSLLLTTFEQEGGA